VITTVTGVISIRRVATGSKAEQLTVLLTTDERSWLLRRSGGTVFGVDPELAKLDGRTVTVAGFAGSGVFLATEVTETLSRPG
jgi:hypothetical protein